MATPGRRPIPDHLKVLRGNPGKRPINRDAPKPPPLPPECPEWLPAAAQEKWHELAPHLTKLGLLTIVDGGALTSLCIAWALATDAARKMATEGTTTVDEEGLPRKHPAHQIWRENIKEFRAWCTEFGLTPSSRSRIDLPTADEEDDFEAYLNGKPSSRP